MAARKGRRVRGLIETLPSGSLRVKVYAGIDPVSKKRLYLDETLPAGPGRPSRRRRPGRGFLPSR